MTDVRRAVLKVVIEKCSPFGSTTGSIPGCVDEDEMTRLWADAKEIEGLRTTLNGIANEREV